MRGPEAPEAVEPHVDLLQRPGVHRVQPPGPAGPHGGQAAVPEHPEVLRDGRLGDPELRLDDRADRTGGQLPLGQQLEDPPPHRIAKYIERVHLSRVSAPAYISKILCRTGQAARHGNGGMQAWEGARENDESRAWVAVGGESVAHRLRKNVARGTPAPRGAGGGTTRLGAGGEGGGVWADGLT